MTHTSVLWLPQALRDHGVNVVELDGWQRAQGEYFWTALGEPEPDPWNPDAYRGDPSCYMIHHTATSAATPGVISNMRWSKANCWAGLWRDGKLYQSGGGVPTVVFTSAGPARVSSGYGHGPTLFEVVGDVRVPWRQTQPDTGVAANRYAWNVETVARGDGTDIDDGVEAALIVMGALLCDRYGWSPWRTIGHLTWTVRKVDPYWQGQRDRIVHIQDKTAELMGEPMFTHYRIGNEYAEWEPVVWWLYMLAGGDINANNPSSQVQTLLPWKTNVRLVQREDFDMIADFISLSPSNHNNLYMTGLYRWGKELAELRQNAYT